jgi:zinc protease
VGEFLPETSPDRAPSWHRSTCPPCEGLKGDPAVTAGEAFDPTPANLTARTERFTLPNGLKVSLLRKKTRGATVDFELRMDYGNVESLRDTVPLPGLTAAMLTRGTRSLDRQAFDDALDERKASCSSPRAPARSWEAARPSPRISPTCCGSHRRRSLRPRSSPRSSTSSGASGARASNKAAAIRRRSPAAAIGREGNPYPPGDVRYVPTIDEEIALLDRTTVDAVKAIPRPLLRHQPRGARDRGRVRCRGHPATGRAALRHVRQPDAVRARARSLRRDARRGPVVRDAGQAQRELHRQARVPLNDLSADFGPLVVANRILGGDADSRLFERIRVREGLSYGVGTQIAPAHIDTNTQLVFYAIFAPQNLPKVKSAFAEELTRARSEGFTVKEIETARKSLLEERKLARVDDGDLAGDLVTQDYLGRNWADTARQDAAIAAATPAAVNAALRRYVTPETMVRVYAGDFRAVK